jgi:hypothetical protein
MLKLLEMGMHVPCMLVGWRSEIHPSPKLAKSVFEVWKVHGQDMAMMFLERQLPPASTSFYTASKNVKSVE